LIDQTVSTRTFCAIVRLRHKANISYVRRKSMLRSAIAALSAVLGGFSVISFAVAQSPAPSSTPAPASPQACQGQAIVQAQNCVGDGLEPEEEKLYRLINEYRAQNRLPAIPRSPALNLVANRHVRDLVSNVRKLTHSWSNCPYNASDRTTYPCMWEAPKRLHTNYPGMSYENAHFKDGGATAESALSSWQASDAHKAVILSQGVWQDYNWQAIGIGIYQDYAVIWLGKEADPDTTGATSASPAPARPTPAAPAPSRPAPFRPVPASPTPKLLPIGGSH
jgi:Cysteine-rich secretory protein family